MHADATNGLVCVTRGMEGYSTDMGTRHRLTGHDSLSSDERAHCPIVHDRVEEHRKRHQLVYHMLIARSTTGAIAQTYTAVFATVWSRDSLLTLTIIRRVCATAFDFLTTLAAHLLLSLGLSCRFIGGLAGRLRTKTLQHNFISHERKS